MMSDADANSDDTRTPTAATENGVVLTRLLEEAVGSDLAELDGNTTLTERGDTPNPAARVVDSVAKDAWIVGVIPRVEPSIARGFAGTVDGEVRLVFTGSAGDRLLKPSGAPLRAVLTNHDVEASVHDGDSPVGVLLVGECALVGLFDADGLAAVLVSDSPAVREWAAATCQRYVNAAEPV